MSVFSPLTVTFTLLLPAERCSDISCLMLTPEETSICRMTVKSVYLAFFIIMVQMPSSPVAL